MFDSHFHVTDPRLITEITTDTVLTGVEIGADFETLPLVFDFATKHPEVYCTAGVHPEYADIYSANDFENFVASNLANPKFVAIGECGLDFHQPDLPSREQQIAAFVNQIHVADRYKKPLVIHSRDAWDDTAAVLIANRQHLRHGVLIHCMSYTAENALYLQQALPDVALYFAFGGQITFKSRAYLADTLRAIPRDRILIETDAPYLAPVPKRGEINRPEYIAFTAAKMADILNLTIAEIEALTKENAYRFYQIKTAV